MIILALLAFVLFAAAVTLVVSALVEPSSRRAEQLGQIEAYGYAGLEPAEADHDSFLRRAFDGLAGAVGSFSAGRIKSLREDEVQRRLISAGFFRIGARRFNGYRVLLTIGAPLVVIWLLGLAGAQTGVVIFLALAAAIMGWLVPSFVLERRTKHRLEQIDYDLPELIDLLVVTLEAGVAFAAALQFAAERLEGPLGDEVRLTIQEQSLGLTITQALENWLTRCDTPSVRSFVRSMVQGERLGVSIGQILRNLAIEMRARRQAMVEERAQKAPVKILFPLVFLIFPAMFVVLLGPAIYRLADTLGH
jgi:tight adherence protein C